MNEDRPTEMVGWSFFLWVSNPFAIKNSLGIVRIIMGGWHKEDHHDGADHSCA